MRLYDLPKHCFENENLLLIHKVYCFALVIGGRIKSRTKRMKNKLCRDIISCFKESIEHLFQYVFLNCLLDHGQILVMTDIILVIFD